MHCALTELKIYKYIYILNIWFIIYNINMYTHKYVNLYITT